jgi:hypothetical protein
MLQQIPLIAVHQHACHTTIGKVLTPIWQLLNPPQFAKTKHCHMHETSAAVLLLLGLKQVDVIWVALGTVMALGAASYIMGR